MRILESNFKGLFALSLGVGIVGAAVVMAQKEQVSTQPIAVDARALSSVFREVARNVLPSIVSIETEGKIPQATGGSDSSAEMLKNHPLQEMLKDHPGFKDYFKGQGMPRQRAIPRGKGSGFIIDSEGIVITNSHVVVNAEKVTIRMHDGREFLATDVRMDPRADIAILRFDAPLGTKAVALGDSDLMQIGDWVMAVGSPFGLDLTVTQGIVSAKGRGPRINERENYIQTDAAVNPGNSGGPLLNLNGEVIGINTAISTRSGGYDGVSFAIPMNMAKWVSNQLIEDGSVKRAYLGVAIQSLDSKLATQYGFEKAKGAIVTDIFPDSPADQSGVKIGDLILELDGKTISTTRGLQAVVEKLSPEKSYDAKVIRNGQEMTLKVQVGVMPGNFTKAKMSRQMKNKKKESSAGSFKEMGIEVQDLNDEILGQMGFGNSESVKGVVITHVESGSVAHSAGLRTGVIIETIGTIKAMVKIESQKDFEAAIKDLSVEDGFTIQIRTPNGRQFIAISSN